MSLYSVYLINDCIYIVSDSVASVHKCLHDATQAAESCMLTCSSLHII